tara:strand:+ start:170 stop:355 length:186 start_codon:yes stop_codon:yes gene_type:complete
MSLHRYAGQQAARQHQRFEKYGWTLKDYAHLYLLALLLEWLLEPALEIGVTGDIAISVPRV